MRDDENGTDFLGMRLAVVLIAAALLISLAVVYVNVYMDGEARERARQEALRIASVAEAEYASGAPGSTAPISVSMPDVVERVDFADRTYTIEFRDGSREVRTADCRFSPTTLYPGRHRLLAEVVTDGGDYYVSLAEE